MGGEVRIAKGGVGGGPGFRGWGQDHSRGGIPPYATRHLAPKAPRGDPPATGLVRMPYPVGAQPLANEGIARLRGRDRG